MQNIPAGNENDLESRFVSALEAFAAGDDTKRNALFVSYYKLCGSIHEDSQGRDRKLLLIFSSLIEGLDSAPDGEIAATLYSYTFKDFLEQYSEESVIQAAIKEYIDKDALAKLPLRIALARRLAADDA